MALLLVVILFSVAMLNVVAPNNRPLIVKLFTLAIILCCSVVYCQLLPPWSNILGKVRAYCCVSTDETLL